MIKTVFSASRISELLANGSGKTAQNYILDLALQSIGIKEELSTPAMKHGIQNQMNAFHHVVQPLHNSATWHDEFININEYCGASPDVKFDGSPIEIKCPYYIDTFLEQINSVPTKYYNQVQMQMMACKSDLGRLVFYLTKPEEWGSEEISEYPFPLELRFKIFEFSKDEELQDKILSKVEESHPKKLSAIKLLSEAEIIDEDQFFYEQISGYGYRKITECSNIFNIDRLTRVGDKFYYPLTKKDKPVKPPINYCEEIKKGKELKKKVGI